jgi:hypothetical protein
MTRANGFTLATILATTTLVAGCSQAPPRQPAPPKAAAAAEDHGHSHAGGGGHSHGEGPHGGTLADWGGGKYHVEFTVDHDTKEAVVYVLGSDEKTPTSVRATDAKLLLTIREPSFQVELTARPLADEADGGASCYGGTHESLGIVREFAGTVSGEIDGTPYAGEFAEQPHGDHDHP